MFTLLPEVVQHICSFLPTSDLISCTLVNSAWEAQARTQLLERNQMLLYKNNKLDNYIQVMKVRSHCHRSIMFDFSESTIATYLSDIDSFMSTAANYSKVRDLRIHWILEDGFKCFDTLQKLPNLKSLTLGLFNRCYSNNIRIDKVINNLLQNFTIPLEQVKSYHFPKLTRLGIGMYTGDSHYAKLNQFLPVILNRIVHFFPNVSTFQFCNSRKGGIDFVLGNNPPFPSLKSLSLEEGKESCEPENNFHFPAPPNLLRTSHAPIILTRLELNTIGNSEGFGTVVLKNHASTLKFLHIILTDKKSTCLIPSLPQLKVLKISHCRYFCDEGDRETGFLKFETEDVANNIVFEYGKQFPQLECLILTGKCTPFKRMENDEELYFEFRVSILYSIFLAPNTGRCGTLRELIMPFPKGNKFKFRNVKVGADCERNLCNCKISEEFFKKVAATFPNVNYAIFDQERKNVEQKRIKEWVETGKELGLLEMVSKDDFDDCSSIQTEPGMSQRIRLSKK